MNKLKVVQLKRRKLCELITFSIMSKCASPGCLNMGIMRCSVCLREPYCCGDCQKVDWKSHKLICKTLKKLSNYLQSYTEVVRIIKEIAASASFNNKRILEHLLSYAEFQFGNRVQGKAYRNRGDCDSIDNYYVEICVLISIYTGLIDVCIRDKSLTLLQQNYLMFPYHEKIFHVLRPWAECLDLDATSRVDILDKGRITHILHTLSNTERDMARIFEHRSQFDLASNHFERALSYARRIEGKTKESITVLRKALRAGSIIRKSQNNYAEAVIFAEEAYNCVVEAYNPVHPEVQEAAGSLIELLVHKGDFFDAGIYIHVYVCVFIHLYMCK